jgi:hypothetical protein
MNHETSQVPRWLVRIGQVALPGTVLLAVDLIYEQTFLTWAHGAQMVGFAVSHLLGPLILLLLMMAYTLACD